MRELGVCGGRTVGLGQGRRKDGHGVPCQACQWEDATTSQAKRRIKINTSERGGTVKPLQLIETEGCQLRLERDLQTNLDDSVVYRRKQLRKLGWGKMQGFPKTLGQQLARRPKRCSSNPDEPVSPWM